MRSARSSAALLDQPANGVADGGVPGQHIEPPIAVGLGSQRRQGGKELIRIRLRRQRQYQSETGPMAQAGQYILGDIAFHLRHAPADGHALVEFLRLPDGDVEAVLHQLARTATHIELDHMFAVPQGARRAVECETAAQRIHPIGERDPDILARQAIMCVAKRLVIQHDLDPADPGTGQGPSFDGQASSDRFDGDARHDCGGVDLQAELRGRRRLGRRRRRFVALNQDVADLVLLIVEPVAHDDTDLVFAGGHIGEIPDEAKAGVARHGDVAMFVADILAQKPELSVAYSLAVEINGNR